MGFRFRKRIKIAPGIHANMSKSGISYTAGKRGANINVGGKRGARVNLGIPGTGLSYSQKLGGTRRKTSQARTAAPVVQVRPLSKQAAIMATTAYRSRLQTIEQTLKESETALEAFHGQVGSSSYEVAGESLKVAATKAKAAYAALLSETPPEPMREMHQSFVLGLAERIEGLSGLAAALSQREVGRNLAEASTFQAATQRYDQGTAIIVEAGRKQGMPSAVGHSGAAGNPNIGKAIGWAALGLGVFIILTMTAYIFPLVILIAGIPGFCLLTNVRGSRALITESAVWPHLVWLRNRSPITAGLLLLGWTSYATMLGISFYAQ